MTGPICTYCLQDWNPRQSDHDRIKCVEVCENNVAEAKEALRRAERRRWNAEKVLWSSTRPEDIMAARQRR